VIPYNAFIPNGDPMIFPQKAAGWCLATAGLILFVLFYAALVPAAHAQAPQLSPEKRSAIEAAVAKFMASTHVPGVSVAVVEHGTYEWADGFGFADLENNSPASEHTLYRLGSISKSLSATGAMELWEQGKLDLDAPVQKYCPAFPQKPWPITTRQTMGHLAGIRHYKGGPDDLEINNTRHFDDPIQGSISSRTIRCFPSRAPSFIIRPRATPWWAV